jgi:hypothetical protein
MPDLTPSLDILRRLGLSAPPASPVPNVSREDYDTTVRASQANDPSWKKAARIGIGALGGVAKGLVGTDPSEELRNRIINGVATPDEKAEWYSAGAGQIAGQVSDAGLPFAAINKGPVFHGAPRVFEKFDPTRYDKNDVLGWMTHFAENPEYAESYAMGNMKHSGKAEAPNMIAAHPQAQNTLDLVNPNMDDLSQAIASFPKDDYRRKQMIKEFKDARRYPGTTRNDLSQTHYPNKDEIPDNEIPMFHLAENLRFREGDLEKTPFDAIRYNDMDKKSWAIPAQTPITTPWGARLNDVPKDLTVTRLPEGIVGKSELELHPERWKKNLNTPVTHTYATTPSESTGNWAGWKLENPYTGIHDFANYVKEFGSGKTTPEIIAKQIKNDPDIWKGYTLHSPTGKPNPYTGIDIHEKFGIDKDASTLQQEKQYVKALMTSHNMEYNKAKYLVDNNSFTHIESMLKNPPSLKTDYASPGIDELFDLGSMEDYK